jgi:hypothetical protein
MSIRKKAVTAIVMAAAALGAAAPSGNAAPFLPVGSGQWGPSPNVSGTCGQGTWTGTTTCSVSASSSFTAALGRVVETCNNASYVITTPVIIGTNPGCHTSFSASLEATGAGTGTQVGEVVEINVGACAGLTLSNATVTVTDNAVGTFVVPVRVVVTNAGWKFQGNLASVNATTTSVVVLNVAGTITPGCKKAKAGGVTFTGLYSGNYQFL